MLTRRYGVALGIAIALTILAPMTVQPAPAVCAARQEAKQSNAAPGWIALFKKVGPGEN